MQTNYENLQEKYSNKQEGYYDAERSELLEFIPHDARTILDVGCSSGNFGQLVKKHRNCVYWGIEPDKRVADRASKKLDKVINKTFSEDLPEIQNCTFDVICFNDVLEHLINPEHALRQCKNKLTENGIIIASIPNILYFPVLSEILIKQDWQYQDSGILDDTHLRFFTKKSIIRMFENNGYEIIRIVGINPGTSRKYKIINLLLLNYIKDWKYSQFVVQAKKSEL